MAEIVFFGATQGFDLEWPDCHERNEAHSIQPTFSAELFDRPSFDPPRHMISSASHVFLSATTSGQANESFGEEGGIAKKGNGEGREASSKPDPA